MTIDAIIMMVITLVGYIGGFSYFMIRVFKKERSKWYKQENYDAKAYDKLLKKAHRLFH